MLRARNHLRAFTVGFLTLALLFVAATSLASDDEAAKLETRGKALRYSMPTKLPDCSIDTGGAAILVHAPIDVVRKIVTDYQRYQKIVKTFRQSRLISKKDGVSEVYLDVPVAHGAASIWAVISIAAPVVTPEGESITGTLVKGNVDAFRSVWRLRKVDEKTTILKLELLVDPKLPVPSSLITPELQYAADTAVTGVRDEAHRRVGFAGASTVAGAGTPDKPPSNVAKR